MRFFIYLMMMFFLVSACGSGGGGGGSDSDDVHMSTVQYTVDDSGCLIEAKDYDDSSVYTDSGYQSVNYIWICTTYNGQSGIYVSLSFDNGADNSGCLKLDSEYLSSGICY